ncbi:DsbA family protein [Candidatus Woesearchaeota archaeon]|jgi:protein-disulfide isomerase|nr:DsbA family protein [Candidatus Woesearchaeota archaeon]
MTHYEKEEHEQHQHKKHEHHVRKEHQHTEKKHEHKKVKDNCCGTKLNSFQKFLAVAVIIQVLLLVFIAVKISALSGVAVEGNNVVAEAPTPSAKPSNNGAAAVDMATYIDDDSVKGDKDAPVTIVEFSDYECPFCTKFYEQSLQLIEKNYIDTGKVKFIYRDFPLSFHQNAQKAAEAAECAGEQDKYFEMHDLLFEKGVSGGVNAFKQYAKDIGLNTKKFDQCLDSGAMAQEVKDDFAAGQQLGVSGTPAFFINGKLVSGAQPYSVFEQIIEQELSS